MGLRILHRHWSHPWLLVDAATMLSLFTLSLLLLLLLRLWREFYTKVLLSFA